MDWLEFLSFLLSPLELSDSEPVVVYGTDYLQQVSELINQTEPRYGGWGLRALCRSQAGTEHREMAQPDTEGFDKALDLPNIKTQCLWGCPPGQGVRGSTCDLYPCSSLTSVGRCVAQREREGFWDSSHMCLSGLLLPAHTWSWFGMGMVTHLPFLYALV